MSFFGLFKTKPKSNYYDFCIERDSSYNRMMQKIEDEKIDSRIKSEARRLFYEWQSAEAVTIAGQEHKMWCGFINPMCEAYLIYDEDTARHLKTNQGELIWAEFNRLKEDFKSE